MVDQIPARSPGQQSGVRGLEQLVLYVYRRSHVQNGERGRMKGEKGGRRVTRRGDQL